MPVKFHRDLEDMPVRGNDIAGVSKKVPIGKTEGWEGYVLRVFKIAPGGQTPRHRHDWEHVNAVLSGRGRLFLDGEWHELAAKDFAFVPPNALHQFQNPYDADFEFICIVPDRGEK